MMNPITGTLNPHVAAQVADENASASAEAMASPLRRGCPSADYTHPTEYGPGELLFAKGGTDMDISYEEIVEAVQDVAKTLGEKKNILIVPPDFTRAHSMSGKVTKALYDHYGTAVKDILPALGSHVPVTISEKDEMFKGIPHDLFRVHDWRTDVETIGEVPGEYINQLCDQISEPYPVQVNKMLLDGGYDAIFSVGQAVLTMMLTLTSLIFHPHLHPHLHRHLKPHPFLDIQVVPHEVAGMANHTKNILVGTGGKEAIDQSHFLGAAYGMERIMGRGQNPVRSVYDKAFQDTILGSMPFIWIQTVVSPRAERSKGLAIRGLFIGDGTRAFTEAAKLSVQVHYTPLLF